MSIKDKIKKLKEKVASKTVEAAVVATTLAPMAPTNADAATPTAPEQPKTEQYAPKDDNHNDDGRTSYGFRLEPVESVPGSGRSETARVEQRSQARQRQRTPSRSQRELTKGTPEWAMANGWVYDAQLSNGLNRIGASDGSHNGFQGAYYKADDPEQIMFLPNDPIHDKPEFNPRAGTKACQRDNTHWYSHRNHDPHGYGCPDQKRNYGRGRGHRIGRVIGTLEAIRRAHGR